MSRLARSLAALALLVPCVSTSACGGDDVKPQPVAPVPTPTPLSTSTTPPSVDVLGERPALPAPPPYTPPVPVAYKRANGMTVWLLERHTLPIVSVDIVVPAGAALDPPGKGGLASVSASMLDEGAGARGALEISRDVDRLGATLHTGAYADYAFAQLTVLKKNLAPAAAILGDVVAKPTFSAVEWKRVHDLWQNELKARQSDPQAVADVVSLRQVFGQGPYGHPTTGTTKTAAKVSLEDAKAFYAATWRPDRATCVVVGDITRAELDPLLDNVLGAWKVPAGAKPDAYGVPGSPPPPGASSTDAPSGGDAAGNGRRVVVVDRPDAPQSVIALVRPGVAASTPEAAPLVRVNAALGGSFTSRLNQDLREAHGWSYGARSRFTFNRGPGMFSASAAVHTEHTGEALKAMIADVEDIAEKGLVDEEVEKTRLLARADLVEAFEGVAGAAQRLARDAGVGLPPDFEAQASARLYAADKPTLARLAKSFVDPKRAVIVIVGPKDAIGKQLAAIGIKDVVTSTPEGE